MLYNIEKSNICVYEMVGSKDCLLLNYINSVISYFSNQLGGLQGSSDQKTRLGSLLMTPHLFRNIAELS